MKKVFLTAAMVAAILGAKAQSLNVTETQNPEVASQFKNYQNIDSVILADGSVIKVGDKIQLGTPFNGQRDFTNLWILKVTMAQALISPPTSLVGRFSGQTATVDKIFVNHTGLSKKSPLNIAMYIDFDGEMVNGTVADFNSALSQGEIINLNAKMSRDEAIATLKQQKDLLDLGMISQEEFDAKKAELSSIILNQ